MVAVVALLVVPDRHPVPALAPSREGPVAPGIPHLTGQRLRITPPAYTGLPPRDVATLDARAPVGSVLDWTLTFAPPPATAALVAPGGGTTALTRRGTVWAARRTLDRPTLYRVVPQVPAGTPLPPLHRLDAVPDAPPQVRVIAPAGLTLVTPGQRRWPLLFEARDDYGVAPAAQLHLTVAEGEGENVKFHEVIVAVTGTGSRTVKRFAVAPDLAALKFVAGSDLVAALEVHDNRTPGPQAARSASVILRWPGSEGEAAGMAGVVTPTQPAYFRSERQIIIDAEALIRERPRLTPRGVPRQVGRHRRRPAAAPAALWPVPRRGAGGQDRAAAADRRRRDPDDAGHARARAGAPDGRRRRRRPAAGGAVRQRGQYARRLWPCPRRVGGRDPARPDDEGAAQGRARRDVAGRARAAPGPAAGGAAVRL